MSAILATKWLTISFDLHLVSGSSVLPNGSTIFRGVATASYTVTVDGEVVESSSSVSQAIAHDLEFGATVDLYKVRLVFEGGCAFWTTSLIQDGQFRVETDRSKCP